MVTQVLSYADKKRWIEILEELPSGLASVFAHPDYMSLYSATESLRLFVKKEKENSYLYPFVERSIPAFEKYTDISSTYGYGGPLVSGRNEEFVKCAINEVRDYLTSRNAVVELIKLNPLLEEQNRKICEHFYGTSKVMRQVVSIPVVKGAGKLLVEEYKRENRKAVRRATNAGVTIEISTDDAIWDHFIRLYRSTMEHNQADRKYSVDESFGMAVRKKLKGNYVLVAARYEGKVISVLLILYDRLNAYCHLIGTELDPKLRNLQANNLLHHVAADWAHQQGLIELMIGGGRTDSEDDTLLRFKASFARQKKEFVACEAILNEDIYLKIKEVGKSSANKDGLLFYRESLV